MKKKMLFAIFAMCLICLCGCSKKVVKENPFITSGRVTEEIISVPFDIDIRFDIMKEKNGSYLFLGKGKNSLDSLWRIDSNHKWEVLGSLPQEFSESEVLFADFFDEKNYFFTIAYDFNQEGSKFETRQYLATANADYKMELIEFDEEIAAPIKKNSNIYGIGKPWKIKAFDSKTGLLLKTYDQSTFPVDMFFVTDDKIVAAGVSKVESYDIETAQICDTKDSLINFLVLNMWQRGGPCCLFYDNDSEIVYCTNAKGIFCYDINSEKEYRPIQNENCTPFKNPLPISGLKTQENLLFLRVLDDPFSSRGAQVYVYTAE